jgi:anion-transporting  ArsA/GET3 family ATPase
LKRKKNPGLVELLREKRIVICCGSGGVGKTTTAAAVALGAAREGKKTIVLTIDPAKRLATALGLESLGDAPRRISLPGEPGTLSAMMLDTKRTFDRVIERYVENPERRRSILENRLYQHMSRMIAGSQEYMAMEKLYELYEEGGYDLLVLDTPPTRHALDFLEAPRKMINMTSNSLLEWFLKPGLFVGQAGLIGLGVLRKGAEKILSVFDRLAGFSFLHELSEMLALFSELLGGFQKRARAVYEMLRRDFVGFLLVTSPASVAIQDALYFHRKIDEGGLPFLGFVVNRVHPENFWKPSDLPSDWPEALKSKALNRLEDYEQLARRDQKAVTLLRSMGGKGTGGKKTACAVIPLLEKDVHDLDGLTRMYQAVAGSGAPST